MTEHDEQFDCNSDQVRDAERRLAVQHKFIGEEAMHHIPHDAKFKRGIERVH